MPFCDMASVLRICADQAVVFVELLKWFRHTLSITDVLNVNKNVPV